MSRTVTAFFTAQSLKDSILSWNTPSRRGTDLASVFIVILGHLLLSPPAAGFFVALIIHDPSFYSSGGFMK